MPSIRTDMVEMNLDQSGVVRVTEHNPEARHTAETMDADLEAFRTLTNGQALPAIWDVRRMSRPTPVGWQALMEQLPEVLPALALVVDDESRLIAGAFPEALNAFMLPTRVFEDLTSAQQWAEQFVPEDFTLDDPT